MVMVLCVMICRMCVRVELGRWFGLGSSISSLR